MEIRVQISLVPSFLFFSCAQLSFYHVGYIYFTHILASSTVVDTSEIRSFSEYLIQTNYIILQSYTMEKIARNRRV